MLNGTPDNTDSKQIDYEKRFKDTQAAFTKAQQALKAKEAEARVYKEVALSKVQLSPEQEQELDDLKFSNPDEWRTKINEYEKSYLNELNNKVQTTTQELTKQDELSRRQAVLENFNASRAIPITNEIISKDIPPRILEKLENGSVSFENWLYEVDEYLKTGKVIATPEVMGQPNLGNVAGGTTPSKESKEQLAAKYKNMIL